MMTHKITPSVDLNQWLKRLNTQLNKPINQNSLTSPKLLSQRMRKRYCKTLGTDVINSPLLPCSLANQSFMNNFMVTTGGLFAIYTRLPNPGFIDILKLLVRIFQWKNTCCTMISFWSDNHPITWRVRQRLTACRITPQQYTIKY